MRALACLSACLFCALPALAGTLDLHGAFQQGGMVIGRTEPGAAVTYANRSVRVAADGTFVIGFHRDEPETVTLEVGHPDGSRTRRDLAVAAREYDIQRIDGLPPKKVTPPPERIARIKREAALVRAARGRDTDETWFAGSWIWPVQGRISGVYGSQRVLNGQPRQPHFGIDIAAPTGTPFVAPADGVVSLVHDDMYFSGGTLMVDHGHGVQSTFLHAETIAVREGDVVRQGDVLGTVGATGRATGPHLDWRVNWFDKRLDAALLVPPMGG